ncbi:MAG: hypothetical protein RMJ98_12405 [Myxococcales bacterium]|nr:hypothetical protein [Polyangiaceae bacterium]MDW8250088.1 hypothetical protein [Myxococcales bacterium]
MLVGDDLPQLRLLLWNRISREVSEEEAFELYETNRAWIDPAAMTEGERRFFLSLVTRYGRGHFLG